MVTILWLACSPGGKEAPLDGGAVEDGGTIDGGAPDGGTVDGGGDGGGDPPSSCSEDWPLDTRPGARWSWEQVGCCDAWYERTETRTGLDSFEGEALWRIDEEGALGGEGASLAWTATRWYRCDEVGIFLVAEDRTEQETYDGPGEIVHTVTRWSPPVQVLPRTLAEGARWGIVGTRITQTDDGGIEEQELSIRAEVLGRAATDTEAGLYWTWEVQGLGELPPLYASTSTWAGPQGLIRDGSHELVAVP